MSRNFPAAITDHITLGDVADADFADLTAWSILLFFRVENTGNDDRALIAKYGVDNSKKHILIRTDQGVAPVNIDVFIERANLRISSGNNISLNTFYLMALTNDGGGGAAALTFYLVDMAGTFLDEISGLHGPDSVDLTEPIRLGVSDGSSLDPMDGDIAHACYVDAEVSKAEVNAYRYDPVKMAKVFAAVHGVKFYLPLLGLDSPEPDWSSNGITGTIVGTVTRSNSPPITLLTPKWAASALLSPSELAPVNLPPYGQVIFNSADEENRPRYGQRIARGTEE